MTILIENNGFQYSAKKDHQNRRWLDWLGTDWWRVESTVALQRDAFSWQKKAFFQKVHFIQKCSVTQNTVFQCVKNIFFLSQKKLVFFTEFNLYIAVQSDMSFGSGWTEEFCQPQLCGAEISLPESKKTQPNVNLRLSSAFRSVVRYSRCLLCPTIVYS